jgi:2-polyprenyl-6-methoxyphenol hydroxylase-like FAD-dependent oxidoreductase
MTQPTLFDVFIVGAGPAGCAVALSLAQTVPGLRVAIADPGRSTPFRIGESVPPLIKPFLDQLGVGAAFLQNNHCPSFRTVSAWGSPELVSNEFFLNVHNTGWRLDRARFDQTLLNAACQQAAQRLPAQLRTLSHHAPHWHIGCGDAGDYRATYLIDASGRTALPSRLAGLKPINHDRLVASAVFFGQTDPNLPNADAVLTETCPDGWWYTAALPEGRRVVALMTDADLARRLKAKQLAAWQQQLAQTRHVQPLIGNARPLAPPQLWPANSRYLHGPARPNLLAVGDALSCFDPLSSQGIIKALRSGLFAAYALTDHIRRQDSSGFTRYQALMQREFAAYQTTLSDYHRQEQRWPDAPFWQRRLG